MNVRECNETCRNPLSEEDVKKLLQPEVQKLFKELKEKILTLDVSGIQNSNLPENLRQNLFVKFVSDEYSLKCIAKKCVYGEIGETIVEEMPIGDSDALLEVRLKLLPWWKRDSQTGLPFKLSGLNAINEDGKKSLKELEDFLRPTPTKVMPVMKEEYTTRMTNTTERQMTIFDL